MCWEESIEYRVKYLLLVVDFSSFVCQVEESVQCSKVYGIHKLAFELQLSFSIKHCVEMVCVLILRSKSSIRQPQNLHVYKIALTLHVLARILAHWLYLILCR